MIEGNTFAKFISEALSRKEDALNFNRALSFYKKEFTLFVGPMFGGKTTRMLSEVDRHSYRGRKIYAFKPLIDDRYKESDIVSHNGGSLKAQTVEDGSEILEFLDDWGIYSLSDEDLLIDAPVIAVDEVFMLEGCGEVLSHLFKCGATIIASSIQLNSDGNPFYELKEIMPYATKIEVCPAVCAVCGADAHYTEKTGGRKDFEVEVGGSDIYEPRCFNHFSYF